MPLDPGAQNEKAVENVRELFKTIIATSGIMLGLLWGLTKREMGVDISTWIYIASTMLVISIFVSFLGWQFIITGLENNTPKITKLSTVAYSFFAAWILFWAGCASLMIAMFKSI